LLNYRSARPRISNVEATELLGSSLAEPIVESAAKEAESPGIALTFLVAGRETKAQEILARQATQNYEDGDKEHLLWTRFELSLKTI